MSSSQEVFKKRREGLLDEAYQIALQRMSAPDKGEWDDKALGWCLVDLIKRCVKSGQLDYLQHYRKQLLPFLRVLVLFILILPYFL